VFSWDVQVAELQEITEKENSDSCRDEPLILEPAMKCMYLPLTPENTSLPTVKEWLDDKRVDRLPLPSAHCDLVLEGLHENTLGQFAFSKLPNGFQLGYLYKSRSS
jgi:hypothetical protein